MAVHKRTRNDPRREATRTALIEAAESLFAENGFDAVSVRSIGAAIGSANTNVVAYHFGGKEELIRAIYRHRLPDMDRRRGALLQALEEAGQADALGPLVRAFFLPWFEQVDAQGRHSYARFLSAMERAGMIALRGEMIDEFPHTRQLDARIAALIPPEAARFLNHRRRLCASLVSAALQQIDQEAAGDAARAADLFDNAIAMATAALGAASAASKGS